MVIDGSSCLEDEDFEVAYRRKQVLLVYKQKKDLGIYIESEFGELKGC